MEGDGIQDILGSGLTSDENGSAPSLSPASGELQFASNVSQQLSDCAVESRHLDLTVENHDSGDSKIDKEINKRIDDQDIGEDQSVLRDSIDKYPAGDDGELLENSFEVRSESQEDTFESCEEDETVLGEHASDAETIDHDGEMKGEGNDDSSEGKTSSQSQTSVLPSDDNLLNGLEESQDGAWMTHDAESSTRTEEKDDHLENAQVNSVPTKAVQMKKEPHCQTDSAEADTALDDNELQVDPTSPEADAVLDDNGLQVQPTSLEADAVLDEKNPQVHPALSEVVDTVLEKVKPPSYFNLFQTETVHEKDEHLSLSDSSPSVVLLDDGDLHSQPSSSPTEVVLEKDEPFSHSDSSPGETIFEQDELLSNSDSSPSVVLLDERVPHSQTNPSPIEAVAERNQPLSLSSSAAKVVLEKDESLSLSDSSPSVVLLDEGEPCSQSSSSPTETILETFEPLFQRGLQSSDTVLEEEEDAVNTDTASLSSLLDKHDVHSQTGAVLDKGGPLCQSFVEQDEVADRNSFQSSSSVSESLPEKHRSLLQSQLQPDDILTDEAESLRYSPDEAVVEKCENHKLCSSPATDITVKTNLPPEEGLQSTDATLDRDDHVFLSGLPSSRDILGKQVPFSEFFYDGQDKSVCSSDSSSSAMDAIVEKGLSQAELSSSGGLQETSSRMQPVQVTFGFETLTGVSVGDSTDHSKELQSGMESEGKQLCTCSLVEQFNRDWSIRCSQLQNLTPEQYHLVLLEHLQFVQKLIISQPSGHPIPASIDGENKNTNSSVPGHEGIQPCPLHGFMSQAEGSLLNLYFNHEGILPGSSGLAGGIAGLLDSLGAQAQSSAQEEAELPQGKKLMKLKDRIEKELQNLHEKEKYIKKTLRELTTSKTKVEKEWGAYISQLHSRLDKQHRLAKEVFHKKHSSCEKKIKERQVEVCNYQTQLTNLLARVEAALHHDGCPQPSSGFKTLKKELTTILSMMPEFQVEVKQSYILDLPEDITKNLSFIAGSVKVKVNYSSFSEQETSGQNEEATPPTGAVISAQHTEMSPVPQCNSFTAQQHEVLTSLPDPGSTIIPDKSFSAESRTAPQKKIAETSQLAGIMGPQKQEIADTQKKGAGVEQSQTSRASSKSPVASCENITPSQQYVSSQSSKTGATQIGSTVAAQSNTTMQNATSLHSVTGTELKISATALQSSSAILGQIESTVQNKHIADRQVKSTSAPQSKNTSQNKKSPEPQVKSTVAPQSRSTKEPKIKSTTASQSKSTTTPQSTAVLKSKETAKAQRKSTAVVQSTSTSAPQNKSAEAAESGHNMAIPGKHVAESAQSKSGADSLQSITETSVPSERPTHKVEAISHLMEKDAQSQKKAMFVPLALVGPPVPKLAEIKHWSSVPLSTHPAPCADLTRRSYTDRAGFSEELENLSTDLVANDTDSSLPQTVIHQTSAVRSAMQDLTSSFSHHVDMPPSSFAGCTFGQSMSYAAVAQKPPVPVPPGGNLFDMSLVDSVKFSKAGSSGAKVGKSRQRKRSRRGGKGKKQTVKVSAFEMPTSIMPSSIREDTSSSPVTFKGCGKVPTSFAPLPNGQVWLAYGDRDPHIDLMSEDKIIERVRVGGNTYQVSCITDECIALLSQSPYPRLLLIDSTKKPSEMHVLDMKTTAFSVGFTGIAVCGYRSLVWIHLNSGAKEMIVSEEDSSFIKTSSCAVMFRDGNEVICVADKGGHAVFFFEKKPKKGAITLEPYTGAGLHPSDQKNEFTPISVSAHSAGFLGILDSTTQSVLILDSKLQLTSVISRQHLCRGSPSVIAFSADSSCKLWVASEPGPLCLAPLLLLYT